MSSSCSCSSKPSTCNPCNLDKCQKPEDPVYESPCDACDDCCPQDEAQPACALYVIQKKGGGESEVPDQISVLIVDANSELDPTPYVGPELSADSNLNTPEGMVFDRQCNLHIAVQGSSGAGASVVKILNDADKTRLVRTLHSTTATVHEVEVDDCGNVYVADSTNNLVQKVSCVGIFNDYAAGVTGAWGLAFDNEASRLYISGATGANTFIVSATDDGVEDDLRHTVTATATGIDAANVDSFTSLAMSIDNKLLAAKGRDVYKISFNYDIFAAPTAPTAELYAYLPAGKLINYMDVDIFGNLSVSDTLGQVYRFDLRLFGGALLDVEPVVTGVASKKGPIHCDE
jgi:hypothetical protein